MNCLFCCIAKKEVTANIVYENDDFIAFNDIKPQAPTHILVIPKQHIESINAISAQDVQWIGNMLLVAKGVAQTAGLSEHGYRLVYNINTHGGQTVYHLHLHILGGRQMTWPPG